MARILLAEGDPSARMALAAMLGRERHEFVLATSPLQLVSILSAARSDLAMVDLAMARSAESARLLAALPVIGISASDHQLAEPRIPLASRLHRPVDVDAARVFVAAALSHLDAQDQSDPNRERPAVRETPAVLEGPDGVRLRISTDTVTVRGQPLRIRGIELRLLAHLLNRRGSTLTIEELAREVWGRSALGQRNFVEARISVLRKKLRELGAFDVIETVRGLGYRVPPRD